MGVLLFPRTQCWWPGGLEPVRRKKTGKEYAQYLLGVIEDRDRAIAALKAKLEQCRKEHGGSGGGGSVVEDDLHLPGSSGEEDQHEMFDVEYSDNEDELVERMRTFHVRCIYFY